MKQDDGIMNKSKETFYALQEETLEYLAHMEAYEASPKSRSILERFVESLAV